MNSYKLKTHENKSITIKISDEIVPVPLKDMCEFDIQSHERIFSIIGQACSAIINKTPEFEESAELIFNDFLEKSLMPLVYTGRFKVSGVEAQTLGLKKHNKPPKRLRNPCPMIKEDPLDVEKLRLPKGHEKEIHSDANLFPYMGEKEFINLYRSIQEHGLLEPIKLYKGKVIDGRNRLRACRMANVEPHYQNIETDNTFDYVMSTNQHRRHLSTGQKAIIAALVAKNDKRITQSKMAKVMNISLRSIATTTDLLNKVEPEVIESLKSGHITINTAKRIARLSLDEQRGAIRTRPKHRNKYIKSKLESLPVEPKETVVKLVFSEAEMKNITKHVKKRSDVSGLIKILVTEELNNYMARYKEAS